MAISYWVYLQIFLWPTGLTVFYPIQQKPYGTLIPAIGLIRVGSQTYADHYKYLPSIGLYISLSWEISSYQGLYKFKRKTLTFILVSTLLL